MRDPGGGADYLCPALPPSPQTPLFILTVLTLCDRRGAGICFCREDPGRSAPRREQAPLACVCVCVLLPPSAQVRTSVRRPEAEAASRRRALLPLILTHFLFPARRSLFNCRAAH